MVNFCVVLGGFVRKNISFNFLATVKSNVFGLY